LAVTFEAKRTTVEERMTAANSMMRLPTGAPKPRLLKIFLNFFPDI
jgi:hypothetical protein